MGQNVVSQSDCKILNQPYFQNNSMKEPDILHVVQIHVSLKLIKKLLRRYGQKMSVVS